MSQNKLELKQQLVIGATIKIGEQYVKEIGGFKPGEIIKLIEGFFDYENGLYIETQKAPSVWNEDAKEFDSIYHLFGNNLENFLDCEILPSSIKLTPEEVSPLDLINEIQRLKQELFEEKQKSLRILTALKKIVDEEGKEGGI